MVERNSQRAGWGQEFIPESGRSQETFPKGREWSEGPPRGPGGIVRPSQRAGKGRETFPEGWKGSGGLAGVGSGQEALSGGQEGSKSPSGKLGGFG